MIKTEGLNDHGVVFSSIQAGTIHYTRHTAIIKEITLFFDGQCHKNAYLNISRAEAQKLVKQLTKLLVVKKTRHKTSS